MATAGGPFRAPRQLMRQADVPLAMRIAAEEEEAKHPSPGPDLGKWRKFDREIRRNQSSTSKYPYPPPLDQ